MKKLFTRLFDFIDEYQELKKRYEKLQKENNR